MNNKRKSDKGLKTKHFLLNTALDLFSSKGFEATIMRDIAKKADLSLGAFYRYFGSKDELILSFYQSTANKAKKENPKLIECYKKFKIRFRAVLDYKLEQLKPHKDLVKILARNGTDIEFRAYLPDILS